MSCEHTAILEASGDGTCFLCGNTEPQPSSIDRVLGAGKASRIELSKRRLKQFLRNGWHVLEPSTDLEWHWHIDSLCDHIQWMLEQWAGVRPQVCQNLLANVPPGSLKSRILSVYAPAWAWIHWPHWSLLALSSNPSVALRDARMMRELIEDPWYRDSFEIRWSLKKDQDSIGEFANTVGGIRKSQGLNAKVTGIRADAIFVDDPNDVKDISETKLNTVWDNWFAARNRLNDLRKSVRIGIMQRVHEADWSGRILEQGGWEHLCIPMEYEEPGPGRKCACGSENCDTTLGKGDPRTKEGEVLHPARNTPEVLADERRGLGSLGWAGQMQQRPSPLGGGMFKKNFWRYFDALPRSKYKLEIDKCVLSVDATFKKDGTSRVALGVIAGKGSNRYVVDVVAKKMGFTDMIKAILDLKEKHPYITKVLIEDKANGSAAIDVLSKDLQGVVAVNPRGDKVSRANAILPQVEAGNIKLLRDAPWLDDFLGEFASFPVGQYDDIVDMLSQALMEMHENSGSERTRMLCSW